MKSCSRCREEKPITGFYRNRSQPDGHSHYCKPCCNEVTRSHPKASEYARRTNLKRRYGITVEEFDALLEQQNGGCAVCGEMDHDELGRRLAVDHDHDTKRVRGLLCQRCNRAVGLLKDNPELALRMSRYLTEEVIP